MLRIIGARQVIDFVRVVLEIVQLFLWQTWVHELCLHVVQLAFLVQVVQKRNYRIHRPLVTVVEHERAFGDVVANVPVAIGSNAANTLYDLVVTVAMCEYVSPRRIGIRTQEYPALHPRWFFNPCETQRRSGQVQKTHKLIID